MGGCHCVHADSNRYTKHSHYSPTAGRHTARDCSNTCYGHPHSMARPIQELSASQCSHAAQFGLCLHFAGVTASL